MLHMAKFRQILPVVKKSLQNRLKIWNVMLSQRTSSVCNKKKYESKKLAKRIKLYNFKKESALV